MKKLFTLTYSIILSFSLLAQIPNQSFENWAGSPEEPVGWATPNAFLAAATPTTNFPVYKSTDAFIGTHSAVLETKYYNLVVVQFNVPGVISTGNLDVDSEWNPVFSGGAPYAYRPDSISAMYKYYPKHNDTTNTNDTFSAFVLLTKYNMTAQKTDTIGFGFYRSRDTADVYTKMNMEVNYLSTETPDTIMLVFVSSSVYSPRTGSKLFLDDIQDGTPVGIKNVLMPELKTNIYPNPAINQVTVNISGYKGGLYSFTLYDILGQRVDEIKLEKAETLIDISKHRKGMYFYEIKDVTGKTAKTGKLNIVR